MANYLSPMSGRHWVSETDGNPLSGAKLFTYEAGTTTKVTTYKDSAGAASHANPIILNSRGEPADGSGVTYPIWQTGGTNVKYVLAPSGDTDPPASPYWTEDNIPGINDDTSSSATAEWVAGPSPTYVSATSFTLVGDQTSTFHVGRRIKTENSGGMVYSTITSSSYSSVTTVTVANDSGSLDSGLSSVSYGLISSANTSDPAGTKYGKHTFNDLVLFTAGLGPGYLQNYSLAASVGSSALTITLSGYDGTSLSSTNKAQFAFRSATAGNGTYSIVSATADLTLTISSGSTLGTTSGVPARFWIVIFNDAGTLRLGAINCSTASAIYPLSDDTLASSTAEGGAGAADSAGVIYTGTAVTSKAMRVIGYVEHTQATAGTYATTPSKVQLWQTGMKLPGDVVQVSRNTTNALISTTTNMPSDDTIPQNTEGAEIITASITPSSSINNLRVRFNTFVGAGSAQSIQAALFRDSTANAVAATAFTVPTANYKGAMYIEHMENASSGTSTTFKARGGPDAGSTTTFNGNGATRMFGGVANTTLTIEEIMG